MPRRPPNPLTLDQKKHILGILQVGCSYRTAAHYNQCSVRDIRHAAAQDPKFHKDLLAAECHAELKHMQNVLKAGEEVKNWRASTWALEHTYPERYGNRRQAAVTREQLLDILSQITDLLVEEIPVASHRQRVIDRLRHLLSELHAADQPPSDSDDD